MANSLVASPAGRVSYYLRVERAWYLASRETAKIMNRATREHDCSLCEGGPNHGLVWYTLVEQKKAEFRLSERNVAV